MSSRGKFMQHLEACLLWQLKLTKFCVSLRCLDVQNEIQLLSKVFCYSWLVCLLGFWLRSTSLVKVGNPISDGLVFVFHLRPCLMRKRVKKPQALLALPDSPQELHLEWVIIVFDVCFCFVSNFMKSIVVYAASLCTFVRFETMVWVMIRFDKTLQNFKKPLDIFSHRK